jgi:hypothetical protein
MISPLRSSVQRRVRLGRWNRIGQRTGCLTPQERARIMALQDLLIERFVEHREAVAEGQEERVKTAEAEIETAFYAKRKRSRNGRR